MTKYYVWMKNGIKVEAEGHSYVDALQNAGFTMQNGIRPANSIENIFDYSTDPNKYDKYNSVENTWEKAE